MRRYSWSNSGSLRLRALCGLLCILSLASTSCGSSVQAFLGIAEGEPICLPAEDAAALVEDVYILINQERVIRGLPALEYDPAVSEFGAEYACNMIEQEFFGHVNPETGVDLVERHANSQYSACHLGENLAYGYSTPEDVVQAWMVSPGHRANILDDSFATMGIGLRIDSMDGRPYWVQVFLGDCETEPEILNLEEPADPNTLTDLRDRPGVPAGNTSGESLTSPFTP